MCIITFASLELSSLWAFACLMNIVSVHCVFKEHFDTQVVSLNGNIIGVTE